MENPVAEIPQVIQILCTAAPNIQRQAIEKYFTETASFTHPFCRTGSFVSSRWLIIQIYRWYKILSPHIDVAVDSVAFDEKNLILYVSIHQTFKIWIVPFYDAKPKLVTVLTLTTEPYPHRRSQSLSRSSSNAAQKSNSNVSVSQKKKYYIQSQNDLYQTNEWIRFLLPWSLGAGLVMTWQFFATFLSVVGAFLFWPITWLLQNVVGGNLQRWENSDVLGKDYIDFRPS